MKQVHLNTLDLNLLRVLSVMTEEQSVTRTGDRLGLTQSAVSHTLGRLRAIFGDPLFVRGPQGMLPTQRAVELAAGIRLGLAQIESALAPTFDSATTDRRFTIVGGAYACMVLGPSLVARMVGEAPRAELRLRNHGDDMYALLDTGQADALIAGFAKPPDRFVSTELLQEEFVWVVRADHPVTKQPLTIEALAELSAVVIDRLSVIQDEVGHAGAAPVSGVWYDRGAFDAELARRNLTQRIGATAPDSLSGLAIVARSDMAALAPRRLAKAYLRPEQFALLDPPYNSPTVPINLIHRRDLADDPARAWLLSVLRETAEALR
ncbi:MAG: LysR family transcriptional regulator [Alphaproteobacteria bacterium]